MRFIPGQDSFSISYRGGRAFDDNFTVDFFPVEVNPFMM